MLTNVLRIRMAVCRGVATLWDHSLAVATQDMCWTVMVALAEVNWQNYYYIYFKSFTLID